MIKNDKSGLDINLGIDCSRDAVIWSQSTITNRKNKTGAIQLANKEASANMLTFGNQKIGISSDGIGTKIELAERTQIYDTLGFDLVAMVADDLITGGFEPTNISNILDVNHLDQKIVQQLMKGLATASNFANISMSGGEIAELGTRIDGYGTAMNFNWAATALGALPTHLNQAIDGTAITPNQVIISLKSNGFRSNGFSLIRKIMQNNFGTNWHKAPYNGTHTWGQKLLTPSLIYTPLVNTLIQSKINLTGIIHITGGGIINKLKRTLAATQLGAVLDNLYQPHDFVLELIRIGKISYQEAYLYWNMGNGMLLITEKEQANLILNTATQMNYAAKVAGFIVDNKAHVAIQNQILGFST